MKSPDLNLLPIAFALYDELSVSRAARLLGMSQPAVSMALRRMRDTFDDPLFIRVPTGIAPTPRAHALIKQARPLVQRLQEDLLKGVTFDPASSTRTVTLALSDVGEMAFLPRVLEQVRAQAPHCAVRSVSVPTAQLAHDLEKGEIDLAVGYFPALALKNFRQRRLSTHRFACLMRADHPLRAERLSPADFLAAEHIAIRAEGRSLSPSPSSSPVPTWWRRCHTRWPGSLRRCRRSSPSRCRPSISAASISSCTGTGASTTSRAISGCANSWLACSRTT